MDWIAFNDFVAENMPLLLGIALFFVVMYNIYLKILLHEERELVKELNQKFTDKRIELFEHFVELFKSYVVESQGQKKHEMSEDLDQAIREFIVDGALLNADKNNALLKNWKKLLNEQGTVPTRKVLTLFLDSIKNMREELGLSNKSFKPEQFIPLIHSTDGEYKETTEEHHEDVSTKSSQNN